MGVSVGILLILQPGLPEVAVAALASPVVSLLPTQSGRHTLLGSLLPSLAAFAVALLGRFREDVPRLVAFLPSFWLLVPGTVGLRGVSQIGVGTGDGATQLGTVRIVASIALGLLIGSALALPVSRPAATWRRRTAQ
ncbi:hypothetical protein BJF86_04165 [Serinicoccus sp. CNJ-927]|nr:hypothetical protein BJF86_04165 [Serinicoccus sp. CNJ-927]